MTPRRVLVELGDKAAASKLFIRAIVETKRALDDEQVEAAAWACDSFGKIAVNQAKLGERDHAAETLELAAGAHERVKNSEFETMSLMDLFKAQYDAKSTPEALQTLDRIWERAKTKLDAMLPLLKMLEEGVQPNEDRRNAPLLDWMRRRVNDSERAREAPRNEKGAVKKERAQVLGANLQNKKILETLAKMQARAGDYDAALKTIADLEKTGMVGAASDAVELRAAIATDRFVLGDKEGGRSMLAEARRLADQANTRTIPPASARLARARRRPATSPARSSRSPRSP